MYERVQIFCSFDFETENILDKDEETLKHVEWIQKKIKRIIVSYMHEYKSGGDVLNQGLMDGLKASLFCTRKRTLFINCTVWKKTKES